jgi:hypothetical protein
LGFVRGARGAREFENLRYRATRPTATETAHPRPCRGIDGGVARCTGRDHARRISEREKFTREACCILLNATVQRREVERDEQRGGAIEHGRCQRHKCSTPHPAPCGGNFSRAATAIVVEIAAVRRLLRND